MLVPRKCTDPNERSKQLNLTAEDRDRPSVVSYDHGNESLTSLKDGEFLG
jgi:hypothetical protein